MTSRTSLTPAVTADSSTKRRSAALATRCASVVLPVPGGPQITAESGPAVPPEPSTSRRSGLPGRSTSACPRTSSSERGRIRTASGGRVLSPVAAGPAATRSSRAWANRSVASLIGVQPSEAGRRSSATYAEPWPSRSTPRPGSRPEWTRPRPAVSRSRRRPRHTRGRASPGWAPWAPGTRGGSCSCGWSSPRRRSPWPSAASPASRSSSGSAPAPRPPPARPRPARTSSGPTRRAPTA